MLRAERFGEMWQGFLRRGLCGDVLTAVLLNARKHQQGLTGETRIRLVAFELARNLEGSLSVGNRCAFVSLLEIHFGAEDQNARKGGDCHLPAVENLHDPREARDG